jgi:hypothetical protein
MPLAASRLQTNNRHLTARAAIAILVIGLWTLLAGSSLVFAGGNKGPQRPAALAQGNPYETSTPTPISYETATPTPTGTELPATPTPPVGTATAAATPTPTGTELPATPTPPVGTATAAATPTPAGGEGPGTPTPVGGAGLTPPATDVQPGRDASGTDFVALMVLGLLTGAAALWLLSPKPRWARRDRRA